MSHPSKRKGYAGEIVARDELRAAGLRNIERTGSLNYKDSAPDLVQQAGSEVAWRPLLIVATQADRRPMLYTMTGMDLRNVIEAALCDSLDEIPVAVQVKKHKAFAIDTLYRKLQAAT